MLTDAALKHLKPKEKAYKVSDRDGMYVRVGTNGTIIIPPAMPLLEPNPSL